jgi:F0F1-type ATP synthase gamma subunit
MSEVGNITVKIGADTYDLKKGLDQAKTSVEGFQKSNTNLSASLDRLAIAGAAAGVAVGVFVKKTIDAMDALDDVSQKTGVAVEALSKLGYVANIEGVGIAGLQQSFIFLSRNMSEAAQNAGSALPAFNALGIAFKNNDGTLRTSEEVFLDVAERFKDMEDGAGKTALAMAIFGRSGASLIPMLNYGRNAIKEYGDELEAFGGVVSGDMARAAAQFNDNIARLTEAAKAVGISLANTMLPALTRISEELIAARKNGLGLIDTLALLGSMNGRVEERLQAVNKQLEQLKDPNRVVLGDRQKDIDELNRVKKALEDLQEIQDEQKRRNMEGPPVSAMPKVQAPQMADPKIAEEEAKKLEELRIREAERLAILAESFMTEGQLEQLKFEQQQTQLATALENRMISEEQYRMWLEQLENEHGARMTEITKKNMSDTEKFRAQSMQKQAKDVSSFLMNMTAATANSSKEMFAINKAASLANGIVTAYESIMDAYKFGNKIGGPPVGAAFAAVAGAAQFAQLRAIASSQFSGAGTTAPSAIGSTAAGVTPVQAVNSGGQAQGGGGGGQTVNIALQGNTFNRDQVRDLITQINEVISDGSTLRLS